MPLSQGNRILIITTFGAVVLSAFIHIGIIELNNPDIRFEVGKYDRSGSSAVASLKLLNVGQSEAKEITNCVNFPVEIIGITTSRSAYPFIVNTIIKSRKKICGKIARLPNGQFIEIYFSIRNLPENQIFNPLNNYIKSISFQGGRGKEGIPFLRGYYRIFIPFAIFIIIFSIIFLIRVVYNRFNQKVSNLEENVLKLSTSTDRLIATFEKELGISESFKDFTMKND